MEARRLAPSAGTASPDAVAEGILSYVRRSDKARVAELQRRLQAITAATPDETLVSMLGVLIDFCYDTIERARRHFTIFESMQAAKNGKNTEEFRRRLLDYLQEGMDPESFQRIVDSEVVDFKLCREILSKINNAIEAGELRGITIRFLESYPEHPVLLALRALSESLSDDCDDTVVLGSLRSLFGPSRSKYSVDDHALALAIEVIAGEAETRAPNLFQSLLFAIEDSAIRTLDPSLTFEMLFQRAMRVRTPGIEDISLLRRLRLELAKLKAAVSSVESKG